MLQDEQLDPKIKNNFGDSALLMRLKSTDTFEDHEAVVKLFLEHEKFNPNVQDKDGNTVLHVAEEKEYKLSVIAIFKDKRTEPFVKNNEGKELLQITKDNDVLIEMVKNKNL